jgi:uncharacterized membrane protein YdjX (TVP38/TMEM64 family)
MSTLPPPRRKPLQAIADVLANRGVAIGMMLLLGALAIVFVAAAPLLGLKNADMVEQWLTAGEALGPLGVLVVAAAFCILALLGAPQFLLVAGTAAVFGPLLGFVYSFIGNILACLLGFWIGKGLGSGALRKIGGPGLERFMARLERHDILACALIRLVPTAPFMIVNMALGATSIRLVPFIIGTAIGSAPKIALLAWAGHTVRQISTGGGPLHYLLLALVVASWIGMGFIARTWMRQTEPESAE